MRSGRPSPRWAARSIACSRSRDRVRDAVLDIAKREATDRAVAAGADKDTVKVVDVDDVPLAYVPGNATRIRVKAVGDLLMR